MLIRIVKLEFQAERLDDFLSHFETVKFQVSNFPGCAGMKLLQDKSDPSIVFTYSVWKNEESLNNYRHSGLFHSIWPTIKPWFRKKAEAWSVNEYFNSSF